MDDALLAAYRATDYRVRLGCGGWASIQIDHPPPASLSDGVGDHHWGFITAWNPYSRSHGREVNRRAQRNLLRALREQTATVALHAAIGVGSDGWKEPSLFVIGPGPALLDHLAQRFEQNAYVYGRGLAPARLRLLPQPDQA
jgi:hypothetical protein